LAPAPAQPPRTVAPAGRPRQPTARPRPAAAPGRPLRRRRGGAPARRLRLVNALSFTGVRVLVRPHHGAHVQRAARRRLRPGPEAGAAAGHPVVGCARQQRRHGGVQRLGVPSGGRTAATPRAQCRPSRAPPCGARPRRWAWHPARWRPTARGGGARQLQGCRPGVRCWAGGRRATAAARPPGRGRGAGGRVHEGLRVPKVRPLYQPGHAAARCAK
jgi:hypothetical protein